MVIALLAGLSAYGLNRKGFFLASKSIVCLIPLITSLVFPLLFDDVKLVYHFWFPLAALAYSLLPFVFFDIERERYVFGSMFVAHLLMVIYIPVYMHTGPHSTPTTQEYLCNPSFRTAYAIVYMLINLSVYALVRINKSYENQISSLNNSLEKTIERRTLELTVRNVQLSEYAFMNSHKVRGPLARILGLLALNKEDLNKGERDEVYLKMEEAAKELDAVVSDMNKKLNE